MIKKELSQRQQEICANIKLIRKELGLTQEQYAGHLGISVISYQFYEQGQRMMPALTATKIIDMAKKVGIKMHIGDLTFNKLKHKYYRTY